MYFSVYMLSPPPRKKEKDLNGKIYAHSLRLCLTVCDPMNCSQPGSSIYGILQARILEWTVMPSSKGSFWPRDRTCLSASPALPGGFLPLVPPGKIHITNLIIRGVISIRGFFSYANLTSNVLSYCSLSIFITVGSRTICDSEIKVPTGIDKNNFLWVIFQFFIYSILGGLEKVFSQ